MFLRSDLSVIARLFASISCLWLTACPGANNSDSQDESASISLSPASIVRFDEQGFELLSEISWSGSNASTEHSQAGESISLLTPDLVLEGRSGMDRTTHRYLCTEPGEDTARLRLNVDFGTLSNLVGLTKVLCMVPTPDGRGDQFYSNPEFEPGLILGYIDIEQTGAVVTEVTEEQAEAINNAEAPSAPNFTHVLDMEFAGIASGPYVAVATRVAEMIPTMDPDYDLFYSVVFETDGRIENNWMVQGDFSYDQFQGADQWFQVKWDSSAMGWSMTRTMVGDDQSQNRMPTNAIFTRSGDMATWLIPRAELGMGDLFYRTATFATVNESFAPTESGGDVNGETPMLPLTAL